MAKEIPDLVAEARAGTGKGAARQARREGKVPGIVYGDHKEPVAVAFDFNNLLTAIAGRVLFDQGLGRTGWSGIAAIVAGMLLLRLA